jgi:hypothetical protein
MQVNVTILQISGSYIYVPFNLPKGNPHLQYYVDLVLSPLTDANDVCDLHPWYHPFLQQIIQNSVKHYSTNKWLTYSRTHTVGKRDVINTVILWIMASRNLRGGYQCFRVLWRQKQYVPLTHSPPTRPHGDKQEKDNISLPKKSGMFYRSRGAQIPGAKSPRQLNFVQWCLIFVGPYYGTCFMPFFWHLQFWVKSYIFK